MKSPGLILALVLCAFIFLGAAPIPSTDDIPALIEEFIDSKTTQGLPNSRVWTIKLLHHSPTGSQYMELIVWSVNPEKTIMIKSLYRISFQYLQTLDRNIIVDSSRISFTEEFCAVEHKGS